ncbi:hypothetical protein CYMTET_47292 [Cymbomonas tetramitiformis]|uniref:Uncharacterized protein n=1 Tax=Cymbomonas tetramitiformis TaxID=36881 RepID=A0AAE0EW45_9CHLO|nr:hypothetical protein CYMTET_47292 [Cymbomonas tetramitiformis]
MVSLRDFCEVRENADNVRITYFAICGIMTYLFLALSRPIAPWVFRVSKRRALHSLCGNDDASEEESCDLIFLLSSQVPHIALIFKYALLYESLCGDYSWTSRYATVVFVSKAFFWLTLGGRARKYFVDVEVILDIVVSAEECHTLSEEITVDRATTSKATAGDRSEAGTVSQMMALTCVQLNSYCFALCVAAFVHFVTKNRDRRASELGNEGLLSSNHEEGSLEDMDDATCTVLVWMYAHQLSRILVLVSSPACLDSFSESFYPRTLRIFVDLMYFMAVFKLERINARIIKSNYR